MSSSPPPSFQRILERESDQAQDLAVYYADDARAQTLALLQHLTLYSQVLVIKGAAGIGKTALLHQYSRSAPEHWRIHTLSASHALTSQALLEALAEAFALSILDQNLSLTLLKHFHSLRARNLVPVVIIDNAQYLSETTLLTALHLTDGNQTHQPGLCLILAGSPPLDQVLHSTDLQAERRRITHEFELLPFSEQDAARCFEQLIKASLPAAMASPPQVHSKKVFRLTKGIPQRLQELAQHGAMARSGAAPFNFKLPALTRPARLLILSASLLLLVIIGGINYWYGRTQPLPVPAQHITDTRPEDLTLPAPQSAAPSATAPSNEPDNTPQGLADHATSAPNNLSAASNTASLAETSQTTPTPAPKSEPRPLHDSAWLLKQPPHYYTLQLAALNTQADIESYIRKSKLKGDLATFPVRSQNQELVALTYGLYPNRAAAQAALTALPKDIQKSQPWLRTLKEIQAQLQGLQAP